MQASIVVQLYYQSCLQDVRTVFEAHLSLLTSVKPGVTVSFYIFLIYHSLRI